MKKILYFVVAAVALYAGSANAGTKIQSQGINWLFNANNATNGVFTVQKKPILTGGSTAQKDTTTWVTTTNWAIPDFPYNTTGSGDGSTNDSVAVARFVVFVDTSSAYTTTSFTKPALSWVIEGSHGSDNTTYTISSGSINGKNGQRAYSIPLYLQNLITGEHPNDFSALPARVRIRISIATDGAEVGILACKAAVQYYKTND